MPCRAELAQYFSDYRGKIPEHELEIFLEAAYHREFPALPRIDRLKIHSGDELPGTRWLLMAREWAEKRWRLRTPVQHLTREQCFFGRYFESGPEALVPRPETEVLVESTLEALRELPGDQVLRGAEIGAGTGAIALTLVLESGARPLHLVVTECSSEALELAKRNQAALRVPTRAIDWLPVAVPTDVTGELEKWVTGRVAPFDFLVSNPPYLLSTAEEVEEEVRHSEPHQALFAPAGDPLYYYRRMAEGCAKILRPDGIVLVELAHERADQIAALFAAAGFSDLKLIPDLAGKTRVLKAKWSVWTR